MASSMIFAQNSEIKYDLSKSESLIKWMTKDANSEYSGSMKLKSGFITMNEKEVVSAVVYVDTKSIKCGKCGDQNQAQKLIEFIKSSVFLNAGNMDYAVFKMYESKVLGKSKDGNYLIKGNLTIIAYSNEVSFPVFIEVKKGKLTAEGNFSINRDLWNLKNPEEKEEERVHSMESKVVLSFTLKSE